MRTLLILSGGIDSSTLLYDLIDEGSEVETLTFNYGSKHNDIEYSYALKTCEKLNIKNTLVNLDFINNHFQSNLLKSGGDIPEGHYEDDVMKKTVVPFRNGIMLSIACGYAESKDMNRVAIANHFGDNAVYPDCRMSFINPMKNAIKEGTYNNLELYAPYTNITKADIIKKGKALNVDYSLTYSCYNGNELHCGKCGTCVERKEAFLLADTKDVTKYED